MTIDSHQRIPRRQSLTPRQEEVLSLIEKGLTNPEIADRLGITLAGAKWHVSEIITKFGVQTREEAVEAWRSEQSLGQRFARAARALLTPILVHKVAVAGVAGALVLVAGGAVALTAYRSGANPTHVSNPLRDLPRSPTYGQVVAHPVFTGYQMFDSNVGWAQANDGNRIILTEDGGRTWKDVSPDLTGGGGTIIQYSVTFLDDNHAWVVANPHLGTNQAQVYWTADRGSTWHQSDSLIDNNGRPALTFLDPQNGWILSGSTLYRTTDSGRTWQPVPVKFGTIDGDPPGSLPKGCFTTLHFVSASRGFAYGGAIVAAVTALPCFFRSDDGGATWQRVLLPEAAAGHYTGARLSFPTLTDGFFSFGPIGDGLGPPVYATHDGGLTWVLAGRLPAGSYSTLQFVDPLHGWTIGQPMSQRTINGGQTWETLPSDTPMPQAEFVSPAEGFGWPAFGQTLPSDATVPGLYHSLDGGQTWQPVQP